MNLTHCAAPSEFLAAVQAPLERNEVANNLMLGTGLRLLRDPNVYGGPPFLAFAGPRDAPVFAALLTPPHPLQIQELAPGGRDVIPELAQVLHDRQWPVSAVFAEEPVARDFASVWTRVHGGTYEVRSSMRVHQLERVIHPEYGPGVFRQARLEELELLTRWMCAFQAEAFRGAPQNEESIRKRMLLALQEDRAYFWDDGGPVCMAQRMRPTRNAEAVGGVYTPPELRGRGYASSCVARLSQLILDMGKRFSCLFTDLANPTSNKIYRAIGYIPVCDMASLGFDS